LNQFDASAEELMWSGCCLQAISPTEEVVSKGEKNHLVSSSSFYP
jgi:hypothetical protein